MLSCHKLCRPQDMRHSSLQEHIQWPHLSQYEICCHFSGFPHFWASNLCQRNSGQKVTQTIFVRLTCSTDLYHRHIARVRVGRPSVELCSLFQIISMYSVVWWWHWYHFRHSLLSISSSQCNKSDFSCNIALNGYEAPKCTGVIDEWSCYIDLTITHWLSMRILNIKCSCRNVLERAYAQKGEKVYYCERASSPSRHNGPIFLYCLLRAMSPYCNVLRNSKHV